MNASKKKLAIPHRIPVSTSSALPILNRKTNPTKMVFSITQHTAPNLIAGSRCLPACTIKMIHSMLPKRDSIPLMILLTKCRVVAPTLHLLERQPQTKFIATSILKSTAMVGSSRNASGLPSNYRALTGLEYST